MNSSLSRIISDKKSGSSELLEKLALLFRKNLKNKPKLQQLIREAENQFNSFGIIRNYLEKISEAGRQGDEALMFAVCKPINQGQIYAEIYRRAFPHIKEIHNIFTFSNSKTIFEILRLHKAKSSRLKIYITESRPLNEARIMTEKLLKENIRIEFGTDAAMASFIAKCDAVFCSADKLLKNGDIINKTGSLNAAIISFYYSKPFYVFSQSSKLSSSASLEENNASEVWKKSNKYLKVRNFYFERIPAYLITKIFTEKSRTGLR